MGSQVKNLSEQLEQARSLLTSDDMSMRTLAQEEIDKLKMLIG